MIKFMSIRKWSAILKLPRLAGEINTVRDFWLYLLSWTALAVILILPIGLTNHIIKNQGIDRFIIVNVLLMLLFIDGGLAPVIVRKLGQKTIDSVSTLALSAAQVMIYLIAGTSAVLHSYLDPQLDI